MKTSRVYSIDGKSLKLETLHAIASDTSGNTKVILSALAKKRMESSRKFILNKLSGKEAIYGVNTGFGLLSNVKVSKQNLGKLQENLVRSHAVGVGEPLTETEVRAVVLLRANTLAQGYSGVSVKLVEALLELLNRRVHPWIPEQGSVGACGDLAPLAHLALVLLGEGRAYIGGKLVSGKDALKKAKLKPYKLQPKEGLALINGTQVMTAIGALTFLKAEKVLKQADVAGAMTIEALAGSEVPFDDDIQRIRPHAGQIKAATHMRRLLADSEIMGSHVDCDKVQDPYSLRCIPQVHGVAYDVLKNVRKVLEVEVNAVTDNPLIFVRGKKSKVVTNGNFHGQFVANAMDQLALTMADLASISEQRLEKLINPSFSDLPAFLVLDSGLNSGFMIVQVAAASLVSENKVLSHPASVDSIPTSADKEDHVSMGTFAARKARSVVNNACNVIAMEFFAAAQGLEFRRPLRPSKRVFKAYQKIRTVVDVVHSDRAFYEDINKISDLVSDGELSV